MTTREQLDSFQRFASEQLAQPNCSATLDELFMHWHDKQLRAEIDEAIKEGLADVDAGRTQPADSAMSAIAQRFGFATEAKAKGTLIRPFSTSRTRS
jgi:predicted transcriptional regulator